MDLRCQILWICWERLFSMLCMMCTDKGSSPNLDIILSCNYVMIMIMLISIYVCMYVVSHRVIMDHGHLMLMFICIYVCMYFIVWQDHDCFMLMFIYIYLSIHVSMSLSKRVVIYHSCGAMIAYVGAWHDEVHCLMRNQVGRLAWKISKVNTTSIWIDIMWLYSVYVYVMDRLMLRDTSSKWKQCNLRHARISMDKTLEARFLGRDNVVLDMWYDYCSYVIYVVHIACNSPEIKTCN